MLKLFTEEATPDLTFANLLLNRKKPEEAINFLRLSGWTLKQSSDWIVEALMERDVEQMWESMSASGKIKYFHCSLWGHTVEISEDDSMEVDAHITPPDSGPFKPLQSKPWEVDLDVSNFSNQMSDNYLVSMENKIKEFVYSLLVAMEVKGIF